MKMYTLYGETTKNYEEAVFIEIIDVDTAIEEFEKISEYFESPIDSDFSENELYNGMVMVYTFWSSWTELKTKNW